MLSSTSNKLSPAKSKLNYEFLHYDDIVDLLPKFVNPDLGPIHEKMPAKTYSGMDPFWVNH